MNKNSKEYTQRAENAITPADYRIIVSIERIIVTEIDYIQKQTGSCRNKIPIDIYIIAYSLYAMIFVELAYSVPLIIGDKKGLDRTSKRSIIYDSQIYKGVSYVDCRSSEKGSIRCYRK